MTYPISTTMLSVPGASTVRGFSLFGTSFVYVLFEDGTDLYWARSRVLESLNSAAGKLPSGVTPELGPDATGVGWIYQYALVDKSGKNDLESLRALQDWFLKYELKTIPGVAEVASVGGAVKEYQIIPDPVKLEQYGVTVGDIKTALSASNQEAGGGSIEMGESEFMVRAQGYLKTLDDFQERRRFWATSLRFAWGRKCAAASRSLTAKVKSRAALFCSVPAATPVKSLLL